MKIRNVLSLFDGISIGHMALNEAGIEFDNYYASEIDPYAIGISKYQYPNIIHIGNVTNYSFGNLLNKNIDLVIGGSPCQSFSSAGNQSGFAGVSGLYHYFEFAIHLLKPKYFFLENVKMKKEWEDRISDDLGVKPIVIDSAKLSAQRRIRNYWTNIPNIQQPVDQGILLKDIIESGVVNRDKSYCIDANYYKGTNIENYFKRKRRQAVIKSKQVGQISDKFEYQSNGQLKLIGYCQNKNMQGYRVYDTNGKSASLTASSGGPARGTSTLIPDNFEIRTLTVNECEVLQTLPKDYTKWMIWNGKKKEVSKTRRLHAIGNGWTKDVIVHCFKEIK